MMIASSGGTKDASASRCAIPGCALCGDPRAACAICQAGKSGLQPRVIYTGLSRETIYQARGSPTEVYDTFLEHRYVVCERCLAKAKLLKRTGIASIACLLLIVWVVLPLASKAGSEQFEISMVIYVLYGVIAMGFWCIWYLRSLNRRLKLKARKERDAHLTLSGGWRPIKAYTKEDYDFVRKTGWPA